MEKNIIILSKKAGSGKKLLNKEKIEEIFSKNNKLDSLTIITTKDKEDVYNLSKYYSEKYGENLKLFISGGDGSISEAIGELLELKQNLEFCRLVQLMILLNIYIKRMLIHINL